MTNEMATAKITLTLRQQQLEEIHALIKAQRAASVSGFVRHAVDIALRDASGWRQLLNDALAQTGGPLTTKERHWADGLLDVQHQKKSPRKRPLC